jgi:alkylation response protein AidB-like acyl-CoA dehydrogenase
MLTDMAVDLDAAWLLIGRGASNAGAGLPNAVAASMAKTYANEMAIRVTHQALQLFGSHSYL